MLKLIVFAQIAITEGALEYPPAVIPNTSLAFLTNGFHQGADAGVTGEATSSVAYPSLAMIAYGSLKHSVCDTMPINLQGHSSIIIRQRCRFTCHHSQARSEDSWMAYHAVSRLQHALDLAAVRAYGQPL